MPTPSRFENPDVPHEVNSGTGSALRDFVSLGMWLALGTVLLVTALTLGMRWMAPLLPFRYETKLVGWAIDDHTKDPADPAAQAKQAQLQTLADQLSAHMALPPEMHIQVHWRDNPDPNAFATLGGHVFIHQGLLDVVDSENALAMVLAHEIAHVRHRDPIASAGAGLVTSLTLGVLTGGQGTVASDTASALSQLHFSRRQERAADEAALQALRAQYGHLNGAERFFDAMQREEGLGQHLPTVLKTHPGTEERLAAIRAAQAAQPSASAPLPLPPGLAPVIAAPR